MDEEVRDAQVQALRRFIQDGRLFRALLLNVVSACGGFPFHDIWCPKHSLLGDDLFKVPKPRISEVSETSTRALSDQG